MSRTAEAHAMGGLGHLIKVVVSYEKAFWRERGLSGQVCICLCCCVARSQCWCVCLHQLVSNQGPLCIVMDNTNSSLTAPALIGFIGPLFYCGLCGTCLMPCPRRGPCSALGCHRTASTQTSCLGPSSDGARVACTLSLCKAHC